MKNFSEKLTLAISVFSPFIVLILIWSAYLYTPQKQELHLEMKHEIKHNVPQHSFQSFERTRGDKYASIN